MGGSQSKSSTSVLSKMAVDAVTKNIMSCKGNSIVSQSFSLEGDGNVVNGIKQVQQFNLSRDCANSASNIADMQQAVVNVIKQHADAQTKSLISVLEGKSDSEVNTIIENDVKQSITQETITEVISNTMAMQQLRIKGNNNTIINIDQSQTLEILEKNVQNVINNIKIIQDINSVSKSESTSKNESGIVSIVSSMFSFTFLIILVVVIAFVIVGVLYGDKILAIFSSKKESKDNK